METINGNEIVKFIYSGSGIRIEGKTMDEATIKFENWINANTPYRGLSMYEKHVGCHLIFEDKFNDQYIRNGNKTYKIDQYENIIEVIQE